ncbi:hypothetical protein [Nostoc sp.]|uniref:hypothetical protein n=1 Tax=Nostoc sp. TaxID=1180 RepID=UPI002FF568D5
MGEAKGGFNPSLSLQLLGDRITTSASGRGLKLLVAKLFFGSLASSQSVIRFAN